jgi:hypothetical protein
MSPLAVFVETRRPRIHDPSESLRAPIRSREQLHAAVFTGSFWDSVPSLRRADCSRRSLVGGETGGKS